MRMADKEADHSIIYFIGHDKLGYFVQQGGMSNSVKRFAEIKGYDDNVRIVNEHMTDNA